MWSGYSDYCGDSHGGEGAAVYRRVDCEGRAGSVRLAFGGGIVRAQGKDDYRVFSRSNWLEELNKLRTRSADS